LNVGDANRDGVVNGSDFALLGANWQGTGKTWDQGDFNDDGLVNGSDFALLGGKWQVTKVPVAIQGVPEPSTLAMFGLAGALFAARRRS
jgi:hypothetical protein